MSIAITFQMMMEPEKHGLIVCSNCNGYGSSLRESGPRCSTCNGVGLVKVKSN
jgi:DnaJ-class molecular chaperone